MKTKSPLSRKAQPALGADVLALLVVGVISYRGMWGPEKVSDWCGTPKYASYSLSKPAQLDAFESLVKSINDLWLTKVKLPQQRQNG